MKRFLLLCSLFCAIAAQAQDACKLSASKSKEVPAADISDLTCIAKNSGTKNTLFFTFGVWCEPCRVHLPGAIQLAKEHNMDMYVVLLEKEDDKLVTQAVKYLKTVDKDLKVLVLKDAVYGDKRRKKNKKFVKDITPPQYENIDDYSKFILLDNSGKVLIVTNWKDYNGNWKDEGDMIKRKILPLL